MRKIPKKAIHSLVYKHDPVLQAIGVGVFRRSRLFVLFHTTQLHPSKPHQIKQPLSKIAVNERTVERCEIIRGVNAWIWIKFSKFGAWKNNSLYKI